MCIETEHNNDSHATSQFFFCITNIKNVLPCIRLSIKASAFARTRTLYFNDMESVEVLWSCG